MAEQYWIVMNTGDVTVAGTTVPLLSEEGPYASFPDAAAAIARYHGHDALSVERSVEEGMHIVERPAP